MTFLSPYTPYIVLVPTKKNVTYWSPNFNFRIVIGPSIQDSFYLNVKCHMVTHVALNVQIDRILDVKTNYDMKVEVGGPICYAFLV